MSEYIYLCLKYKLILKFVFSKFLHFVMSFLSIIFDDIITCVHILKTGNASIANLLNDIRVWNSCGDSYPKFKNPFKKNHEDESLLPLKNWLLSCKFWFNATSLPASEKFVDFWKIRFSEMMLSKIMGFSTPKRCQKVPKIKF